MGRSSSIELMKKASYISALETVLNHWAGSVLQAGVSGSADVIQMDTNGFPSLFSSSKGLNHYTFIVKKHQTSLTHSAFGLH